MKHFLAVDTLCTFFFLTLQGFFFAFHCLHPSLPISFLMVHHLSYDNTDVSLFATSDLIEFPETTEV